MTALTFTTNRTGQQRVSTHEVAKAAGVRHERIVAVVAGFAPKFLQAHTERRQDGRYDMALEAVDHLAKSIPVVFATVGDQFLKHGHAARRRVLSSGEATSDAVRSRQLADIEANGRESRMVDIQRTGAQQRRRDLAAIDQRGQEQSRTSADRQRRVKLGALDHGASIARFESLEAKGRRNAS